MKPDLHRFPLLVAWEMTRAWAETGDYLAADPRCAHTPGQMPLA
jgi:hypothetical protein